MREFVILLFLVLIVAVGAAAAYATKSLEVGAIAALVTIACCIFAWRVAKGGWKN